MLMIQGASSSMYRGVSGGGGLWLKVEVLPRGSLPMADAVGRFG